MSTHQITDGLSIIMCCIAMRQAYYYGRCAAAPSIIFAGCTWVFCFFLTELGDFRHFLLGQFMTLSTLGLLSFCIVHKVTYKLMAICLIDIFFNTLGWALYESNFDATFYDWSFIALYLYAIAVLINWEGELKDGRHNKNSPLLRVDRFSGIPFHSDIHKRIKGERA